jgi:HEPN domain-containing protein
MLKRLASFFSKRCQKFLKAFLLSKGWRLERIHDLEALLNAALVHDPSLEQFRPPCQKITGFYFIERYPFIIEASLTEDDIRSALEQVSGLIEKIQKMNPR